MEHGISIHVLPTDEDVPCFMQRLQSMPGMRIKELVCLDCFNVSFVIQIIFDLRNNKLLLTFSKKKLINF